MDIPLTGTVDCRVRVLLIEDDENDYVLVRDLMGEIKTSKYELEWAANYENGLAAILRSEHDVCLLDDRLGEANGLEILNAMPAGVGMPFILLTGMEQYEIDVAVARAGASDYLVKSHLTAPLLERSMRYALERKRSELRYRRLFETAQDGILILDAETAKINDVNPYLMEMLGYSHETLIGKKVWELGFFKDILDNRARFLELQQKQYVRYEDLPIETADGRQHLVEFTSNVYVVNNKKVIQCNIRDMTARREAQDRIRQLSQAVEQSPVSVVITTRNGNITYVNHRYCEITGYEEEELLGQNPRILKSGRTPPEVYTDLWQTLTAGREWRGELHNRKKNGELFWESASIAPILDDHGNTSHYLAVKEDVTERKEFEEALLRSRDELELRVHERTAELAQANSEMEMAKNAADTANAAKTEFLSRMSHELRTPLNAILGFGQILETRDLDAIERESLDHMMKGGRHLLQLVNEILDISRIEAGRIHLSLEPVDLQEVLTECFDLIRPIAGQHDVRLISDSAKIGRGYVMADKQRLKQVLINLLTNAVKYNHEGGQVSVSCQELSDARLRIEVTDTGPGIPPECLKKLFVPFERLKAEKSGVEGTGLGLTLSRRLVEAMNGTIGVDSAWGVGSTFYIELELGEAPIKKPVLPETCMAPAVPVDGECTVLFIEDNLSNYRLIEFVLAERPGIQLMGAIQGSIGIELARRHIPDLILLDVHLPDIRGDEVLRRLREYPETRDIPVTVVSADATPAQIERLMAGGASAYLTKPINIRSLLQIVDDTMLKQNGRQEKGEGDGGVAPTRIAAKSNAPRGDVP